MSNTTTSVNQFIDKIWLEITKNLGENKDVTDVCSQTIEVGTERGKPQHLAITPNLWLRGNLLVLIGEMLVSLGQNLIVKRTY